MRDGTFTFYALQHRRTHESSWGKPEGKLKKIKKKDKWAFSSWDYFGATAEPWYGRGNDWRPKHRKSQNETHEVWSNTGGCHGWWTFKYAVRALERVRKAGAKGKFDSRDNYDKPMRAVRHEFRLVKVTMSKKTERVSLKNITSFALLGKK